MSEVDNAVALKIKAPATGGALDTLSKIASLRKPAFNQTSQAFPDRAEAPASSPAAAPAPSAAASTRPIVPRRVATVPVPSTDPTYTVSPRQIKDSGPAPSYNQTVQSRFDW